MKLFGRKDQPPQGAAPATLDLGPLPSDVGWEVKTRWEGTRLLDVVGVTKYVPNLTRILQAKQGRPEREMLIATLVHEPTNPHDKNAVRVDIAGLPVGYVKKAQAKNLGPRLAKIGGSYRTLADVVGGKVITVTCWIRNGEP